MTSKQQLISDGFTRIERDDRLLDVFRRETREFGVELWEKWNDETVDIVRIRDGRDVKKFTLPRERIEDALLNNQSLEKIENLADE